MQLKTQLSHWQTKEARPAPALIQQSHAEFQTHFQTSLGSSPLAVRRLASSGIPCALVQG